MKFMNMHRKYYAPNDGEGSDAGGGGNAGAAGEGEAKTYTQAEMDATVNGLKTKNSELIGKQKELKQSFSEASERLKQFDGIDPETVHSVLKRFSDDDEAKLIAEGKIDEVLSNRTKMMQSSFEKEISKRDAELEKAKAVAEKFTGRVLADSIRAAGTEAGIHKSAYDDAIYRAQGAFEINSDGEIIAKEGMLDSQAQPLTPKAWFDSMKEQAPHWFPAPQGGGMGNNAGNASGKKRSEMSGKEKHEFISTHGQKAYLSLPK